MAASTPTKVAVVKLLEVNLTVHPSYILKFTLIHEKR